MPDDDDKHARAFEEARRELEPKQARPSEGSKTTPASEGQSAKPASDGQASAPASLRVVPLPRERWRASDWLPTGEAVVKEFMRKWRDEFYYVDDEGVYYQWNGLMWRRDHCRMVPRLMGELCCTIAADKKKSVRTKLESANFIHGAASRIRDKVAGPLDRFDAAEVLNTTIASIPMNCAQWAPVPHRREDYCSKITAVAAVKGPCLMWLEFLRRITANDNDMIDYLQRVAGYCASPFTTEQAFFFFYGSGGNGKGTFLRVLKRLLGSYATTASLDLFLATKYEAHPEELAALRAMRLVIATETEAGRSWNEAKIKALTGGDSIRARFMRQNSFEYQPCFKIIVSGNHQPAIKNVDPAMRRRLQLVPFEVAIPTSEQDGTLEHRLLTQEGPQILAWVLDGFNEWRKHGLSAPDKVVSSSEEYFEDQDLMAQWIGECCDTGELDAFDYSMTLYNSWKIFAEKAGERAGRLKAFITDLRNRGYQHNHARNGNGFHGIRVKRDQMVD